MKNRFIKAFSFVAGAVLSLSALAIGASAETSADEPQPSISAAVRADVADNQVTLSNDELLLGYISGELCNTKPAHALGPRNLKGNALDLYNYVYEEIEKAAAGQRSSTIIQYNEDIVWTYAELGIAAYDNEVVSDKVSELFRDVHYYLLYDLPYDFYWYDKTQGVSLTYSDIKTTSTQVAISGFGFKFAPATDYIGSAEYTLNTSLTSSASAASTNATAIVSRHAGKDDIAKLTAYKEEICSLVEYNTAAANSDSTSAGINPWQLIYVFDGDSSTNVVCEGYSKAFQYLCNLSSFSGNVYCYTASGDMIYGGNSGPHMWNIVTVNKVNYLIDVTNCDGNSIGAPDNLFMKGFTGSIENGYSRALPSGTVLYTYAAEIVEYYNPNILKLCPNDYDPDNEPDPDYDEDDVIPDTPVTAEEYVVWAGGGKNYKDVTIKNTLSASNWKDAKGKTKKGKLAWVSSSYIENPSYDETKHKLTTKSDKTIATVNSKGKVTAKSGGSDGEQIAYIYATDSGSMTSKLYTVIVKNAPNAVLCFDSADKTDKKEKLKNINTCTGAAATKVYISSTSKFGAVSDDCTYKVTAKKNNGVITIGEIQKDANGRLYFEITPKKTEVNGKVSKVTVTVACDQSGKKTSFKVNVGSPIESVTATTSASSIKKKKDTAQLKVSLTISGGLKATTDKLQVVVCTDEPSLDDTKKKVTLTKSKQITAKLDKNTNAITLKASKDITESASVYLIATDAVTKTKTLFKLIDISDAGAISSPK